MDICIYILTLIRIRQTACTQTTYRGAFSADCDGHSDGQHVVRICAPGARAGWAEITLRKPSSSISWMRSRSPTNSQHFPSTDVWSCATAHGMLQHSTACCKTARLVATAHCMLQHSTACCNTAQHVATQHSSLASELSRRPTTAAVPRRSDHRSCALQRILTSPMLSMDSLRHLW